MCEVLTVTWSWLRLRDCWTPPLFLPHVHSLWFLPSSFQFPVQKINWTHQVQSRRGYESLNPVLCFTCNLIFIDLHFHLNTRNRIKRKRVQMFSSSGQSCQYLTWSASCEIPERDQLIFLYICNKKHFLWSLLFKPNVCSVCVLFH